MRTQTKPSIRAQLVHLSFVIVVVSIALSLAGTLYFALRSEQTALDNNLLNSASILSQMPMLRETLQGELSIDELADYLDDTIRQTSDIDLILVGDTDSTLVYVPDRALVGTAYSGTAQEEALADDVYSRITNVNLTAQENESPYTYFTDELITQVMEALQEELAYTETQASNLLFSGGLEIHTTQGPKMQAIGAEEVNNPDNYDVVYYSVDYQLSVTHADGTTTHYSDESMGSYFRNDLGRSSFNGLFDSKE